MKLVKGGQLGSMKRKKKKIDNYYWFTSHHQQRLCVRRWEVKILIKARSFFVFTSPVPDRRKRRLPGPLDRSVGGKGRRWRKMMQKRQVDKGKTVVVGTTPNPPSYQQTSTSASQRFRDQSSFRGSKLAGRAARVDRRAAGVRAKKLSLLRNN